MPAAARVIASPTFATRAGSTSAAPIAAKVVKYWCVDRLSNPLPAPRGRMLDPFAPQQTEAPE